MAESDDPRFGGAWAFAHGEAALDACWDAFMMATVTPGHPLDGEAVPTLTAYRPYLLSHIFDLAMTVAERTEGI